MSIIDSITNDLLIDLQEIRSMSNCPEKYYRHFKVDNREIDAPYPELQIVQCWISDFIRQSDSALPPFITAYEPGSNIINNASIHRYDAHHLYLDIFHFFTSCSEGMTQEYFAKLRVKNDSGNGTHPLDSDDVLLLTRLSTYCGGLAVGSPSSPAIANRVLMPVDFEIQRVIGADYHYSRYSDDICISSNNWINKKEIVFNVRQTMNKYGFLLNDRKTRCAGKGDSRRVTGITITPQGSISIGRRNKERLKRELYSFLRYHRGNPNEILGFIYFCKQIDPLYIGRILCKYAELSGSESVIAELQNSINENEANGEA